MLTPEVKSIISSTVPVLEQYGTDITTRFYKGLFEEHPELLNVFNQANQSRGQQQTALAGAVYAAAVHIDNLEAILPVVKQIGQKHRALGVQKEHYPIVGNHLLRAMKEVLGEAATPEIIDAWAQAYGVIADAFASVETELYRTAETQEGGWSGFRPFTVVNKVKESDVITSFYLEPTDKGAIASFQPGQYLTVRVKVPGQTYEQRRHYSLSDAPGKGYYRISVKREDARNDSPEGVVSTYLHDEVAVGSEIAVSAPGGTFVLDVDNETPIVFLSGGVGMTPFMSMLNTLTASPSTRPITYIHAAIDGRVHAFHNHLKLVAEQNSNVQYAVVYEHPSEEDTRDKHFVKSGFVDLNLIQSIAPNNAIFYFCGPTPFMKAVNRQLKDWGIPQEQIRYEFFGPQGSLD